ncbi:MAG: hypothetical protein K2X03_11320 [Bryobacteraceae bacterium]|nr:hypothetical protein [Bryobacteraceae bacterium]
MRTFWLVPFISFVCAAQSRTAELTQQRSAHLAELRPERRSGVEEFLLRVREDRLLEKLNFGYNGLGAKIGGLVTGGGFAFGPQYLRDDLKRGAVSVLASAQISTRNYQKLQAALTLPRLAAGRLSVNVNGIYKNYASLQYYGPGPESEKVRTNYRLEDTAIDTEATISLGRHLKTGGAVGYLAVNAGPGTDTRFALTSTAFSPSQVSGLDRQTNFLRYGTFAQLDWRDDAFGPRQGGNYTIQYTRFEDKDRRLHDFNLVDIDLQQYVGFFNKSRVIALRAHSRLTDTRGGQSVPFYLQPIAGGPDDLRGFRPFRFSGNNSLALNAEYRWALFSGCDGALFMDAGKVFHRRGQLNFNNLETAAGVGLRFNARNRTFMRFDVGFSHEGFQVWFRFNDLFQQRPLGTVDSQPIW